VLCEAANTWITSYCLEQCYRIERILYQSCEDAYQWCLQHAK